MKFPDKKKNNMLKMKNRPITKPKKEKVLVVAQEFKFARLLSGNENKTRDRVLKTFKKWLLNCFEKGYEFKEDDFIRVWKGLFYAVWMSDKPLVQEDLCESISEILDLFPPDQIRCALMMTKAGFKVLATEWYGIDHHRMDKFLMLVRRYLRGSFRYLLRCKWSEDSCKLFSDMLSSEDGILSITTPHYARNATSMVLHIIDCYLEELCKISKGEIPEESVVALMYPFSKQVCLGDGVVAIACRRLLTDLMKQSDLGLEYDNVTRAWQKMGCPPGGPDALQAVSDDEDGDDSDDGEGSEEDGAEALDPRAGRVCVTLQPLPVPGAALAQQLRALLAAARSGGYRRAHICMRRFTELSRNNYPLKVQDTDVTDPELNLDYSEPMKAASRLSKLERNLIKASDELALRGLSRKHRKRMLARSRNGLSIVDETDITDNTGATDNSGATDNTGTTNGEWRVESTDGSELGEKIDNDPNKENKHTKKNRKRRSKGDKQENPKKSKPNGHVASVNKRDSNGNKIKQMKTDKENTQQSKQKHSKDVTNGGKRKMDEAKPKALSFNSKEIDKTEKKREIKDKQPKLVLNKVNKYQKQFYSKKDSKDTQKSVQTDLDTPKKVKFVLKNNCMQGTVDYYKSVRQSPSIPFDGSKKPIKANLKPSVPSPINPFLKKKLKLKKKR